MPTENELSHIPIFPYSLFCRTDSGSNLPETHCAHQLFQIVCGCRHQKLLAGKFLPYRVHFPHAPEIQQRPQNGFNRSRAQTHLAPAKSRVNPIIRLVVIRLVRGMVYAFVILVFAALLP